ncbi:hypothetical protein VNO77_40904 [Canavalia gladiata]|uniref:Uncharacterized protein n=1 Tax=Canavalia gladiata TaxID=3824 RepID=A0AAN9K150_CANGL
MVKIYCLGGFVVVSSLNKMCRLSNFWPCASETVKTQNNPMEKKVETVDYRSSPGQGVEGRNVQVVHQPRSTTSGGVLAGAAASVASTLQSAKDAISKE